MLIKIKGEKLKEMRGDRELTQIAEASGGAFTVAALSYWENGYRQPKEESIKALLRVYGCRLEDIAEQSEFALGLMG
jgi:transcriptional regulator with XRE-family HTH domain